MVNYPMKRSIRGQLIRFFVWVILLPLYFFTFGMLLYSRASILDQASQSGRANLIQIASDISNQFNDYQHLSQFLAKDHQLQQMHFFSNANQINQNTHLLQDINQLLRGYRIGASDIEMLAVAFSNDIIFSTDIGRAVQADVNAFDWYGKTMQENNQVLTISYAPGESPFDTGNKRLTETISQFYPIADSNGEPIGVVVVLIYNQVFEESIQNNLGNDGSFIYITDAAGDVVYSPIIQNIPEITTDGDYLKLAESIAGTDWTLHGMVYVGDINQQIMNLAKVILGSLVLITVLMITSAIRTGMAIVRPVKDLKKLALNIEQGDFSGRFHRTGKNEIYDLGKTFNTMSVNLDNLVNQVRIEQKAKREAELEALQANIKPHFLYNTLDTVSWMARQYKAGDIVTTVDALSTYFRVSLSRGSDRIALTQEILHVESYLTIQKVRYEEMLNFSIEMDENCKPLYVAKMILQPLVENAIYHGIKESGRSGIIAIRAWRDLEANCLFLSVHDDGIGMSPERLEIVTASLHTIDHHENNQRRIKDAKNPYGVVNVHQRLQLNFGEDYGLTIYSKPSEGTTALVKHPIIFDDK